MEDGARSATVCLRSFRNAKTLGGHMRTHVTRPHLFSPPPAASSSAAHADRARFGVGYEPGCGCGYGLRGDPYSSSSSSARNPDTATSSASDATAAEDVAVARCLLMLSRDSWTKPPQSPAGPEESDGSDGPQYRCGTCGKAFESYRALGGHRASHKRRARGMMTAVRFPIDGDEGIHACPVCFREFGSGQALGGHKRSHKSPTPRQQGGVRQSPSTSMWR